MVPDARNQNVYIWIGDGDPICLLTKQHNIIDAEILHCLRRGK